MAKLIYSGVCSFPFEVSSDKMLSNQELVLEIEKLIKANCIPGPWELGDVDVEAQDA